LIFELIRALFAAIMAGILPGWFWARCLCAPTSSVERLAYSVALSIALVPAVDLAEVRALGTGLSLPLAIFSVVIVFFTGLAADLVFGPAMGSEKPVALLASPLELPALVPLTIALALVLWADLSYPRSFWLAGSCWGWTSDACASGGSIGRFALPVALLALVASVLHLVASRRAGGAQGVDKAWHEEPPESHSLATVWTRRLALPAVLVAVLARGYLGPVLHDWPFVRGLDLYSHAVMANMMLSNGSDSSYLIYPPGFHLLTAELSRLSALDPLRIFAVLAPVLLLPPTLALYTLGRQLWGWHCGLTAAFFYGVLAGGSYYYFDDAMYPNLVAAQFLLVMTIAALIRLYALPSRRAGLLLALLGSAVVLYHQVASLYEAALLGLVASLVVPYLLLRGRGRGIVLLLSLALLGVLSVLYAWDTYNLPQVFAGLLDSSNAGSTGTAVNMAIGTQIPYTLGGLAGAVVSQPIAWLGFFGALLLIVDLGSRPSTSQTLAHFTLVLWVLLMFVGSRTSWDGFPQRFGRDLGVPLALLGGLAFTTILRSLVKVRKPAVAFAASAAVLLVIALVGLRTVQSFEQAAGPSPELTMSPAIWAAGEWLRDHNTGGNIMVSPQGNQVPSRMMLAMGHYSAFQSFTASQIAHPRDLPPHSPLFYWDVLWVMNHPEGEHTAQILKKYDISYIVLYKGEPDRRVIPYWKLFDAYPNLYRKVYENDDVLIVKGRAT
jgi:hypothetical protein